MNNSIQVFEHEILTVKGCPEFKGKHRKIMEQNHPKLKPKFYKLWRGGVKFKQYVGVIRVGDLTIEVLPKADKAGGKNDWQKVLIAMLTQTKSVTPSNPMKGKANLKLVKASFLDWYLAVFLDEVEILVKKGLLKKYHRTNFVSREIKGRIDWNRQSKLNLKSPGLYASQAPMYNWSHPFNQVLRQALSLVQSQVTGEMKSRAERLVSLFAKVPAGKIPASFFNQLVFTAKTREYKNALVVARMLLGGWHPDIRTGNHSLFTVMFDMNRLWQEYVGTQLRKERFPGYQFKTRQVQRLFLDFPGSSRRDRIIDPDILVQDEKGKNVIILDPKWEFKKRISPQSGYLKQMFVYNKYYDVPRSVLIYPSDESKIVKGEFQNPHPGRCDMVGISVLNKQKTGMDPDFATKLWQLIQS